MVKFVKHFKSSFFTALLECAPCKRVDDGVDAGRLVVSICNPSCCTALNFFYCVYIVCRVWVPDSDRVLQDWALYAVSFVLLFPIFRFLLRKPSVLFALLVMVSMWSPQFRLSCMFTPRYFAVLTFSRLCPCRWYDGIIFSFFRVALNV